MTIAELRQSLSSSVPPNVSVPLEALWHVAKGNWEKAHHLVQDQPEQAAAWVHAHLHRKEGDLSNAHYWYKRAARDTSHLNLHEEWEAIARSLLDAP